MKIIHAAVHGCSSHMNVHACMHVYYLYWYVLSQKMWSGAKNVWADNFFFLATKIGPPQTGNIAIIGLSTPKVVLQGSHLRVKGWLWTARTHSAQDKEVVFKL